MKEQGFTLFIAIVIMGTLLLVSTSLVDLAVKQAFLSTAARESQHAFYAADTGIECALYWDVGNPSGFTAFSTTTTSTLTCNDNGSNDNNQNIVVGGVEQSDFYLTFLPEPYCVRVFVTKSDDGSTTIEAYGYNVGGEDCDSSNPRRLQRAVRVSY